MKLIRRDPDKGYLDTMYWVPKGHVNVEGIKKVLTYELHDNEVIRYLMLYEETRHHLIVPRALWKPEDFPVPFIDCRPASYAKTGVISRIKLDHKRDNLSGNIYPTGETLQKDATEVLLASQGGTLQLACGKGKTVVALNLSALMQVPTLIVVDNTQLLHQWQEEIARHLTVPGGVGLIQGQVRDWKHGIVMATYQTLANWAANMPDEVRRYFGLIIWDEGHHVNAPVFSRSANLFYGKRLALSATPERSDGLHVVCQHHVGPVIFKDVKQKNPPAIYFKWTGLDLDDSDPQIQVAVNDKNGELHLGKLAVYFGQWRKRLTEVVLPEVQAAVNQGRKVLVLSNSVDEVINLMTLWTSGDPNVALYTDIPWPKPEEVGEHLEAWGLTKKERLKIERTIDEIAKNLRENHSLSADKRTRFKTKIDELKQQLEHDRVYKKVQKKYTKEQQTFLKELLKKPSTAGLFTEIVPPPERMRMLKERQVIFAIMKYGKEGLDDPHLDTVIMSEPVSDRNTIQQVMGRPRDKKQAVLTILEDNIGPLISQCKTLRKHFKNWPVDEGGPFKYDLLGHPAIFRRRRNWSNSKAFG